jgi:hypothetical protein
MLTYNWTTILFHKLKVLDIGEFSKNLSLSKRRVWRNSWNKFSGRLNLWRFGILILRSPEVVNLWRFGILNLRSPEVENLWRSGILNLRSPEVANLWRSGIMNLQSLEVASLWRYGGVMNLRNSGIENLWNSGIHWSPNSGVVACEDFHEWENHESVRSQVKYVTSKVRVWCVN